MLFRSVDHGEVAVEGDAAQEGVRGVEVGEEEEDTEDAHVAAVDPGAAPDEVRPQAQADGYGEVGQGQVEEVDSQLVSLTDVLPGDIEREGVGGDRDDDEGQVEHQKRPLLVWLFYGDTFRVGQIGQ